MKKYLSILLLLSCTKTAEVKTVQSTGKVIYGPQGQIVKLCLKDGLAHTWVVLKYIKMDYVLLYYVSGNDTTSIILKSKNGLQVVDMPVGEGGRCDEGLTFKLSIDNIIKDKKPWNCQECN